MQRIRFSPLKAGRVILLMAVVLLVLPVQTMAANESDKSAYINDTNFYSESDAINCSDTSSTTTLTGKDNAEQIFNFFKGKGLTLAQTAGILGNFRQESGFNPRAVQPGGAGRGIAQWSVDGRWKGVLALAQKTGRSEWDLSTQLDYAWQELSADYNGSFTALKAITGNDEAAALEAGKSFGKLFEQFGVSGSRDQFSVDYFRLFQSQGGATGTGGTTTGSTCDTTGGLGIDGNFVFPEKTTQTALKSHAPHWCYDSQTSCHHDYFAADIFNNIGTTNVAATAGTVLRAVDTGCSGGFDVPRVQIKGDDGKYYYYTHMRPGSIKVKNGDKITPGQELGVIGPSECAENTSPHLHFQMSSVPIQNTKDLAEQANYINPQPNLVSAFSKLPVN